MKSAVNPVELGFELSNAPAAALAAGDPANGRPALIDALLDTAELARLNAALDRQRWVPVGSNGILEDYAPGAEASGSWRVSAFDEALATGLWSRLRDLLPAQRGMNPDSETDWEPHRVWRPVGINPLLRFIRYRNGGLLVPHYDAPFERGGQRTLSSLVVYLRLDPGVLGGATRFIRDPQASTPVSGRDLADWDRLALASEVLESKTPAPGGGLLFDHRVLHDGEPLAGEGEKVILRTDVVYEPQAGR